jgi:SAM-dependent methyltransferase
VSGRLFPWLYDAVMRRAERTGLARWRRSIVRPASGRVIEIGAGTGLNFRHYGGDVTVIATEPDLAMLHRARACARSSSAHILLVAADAEALPFPARTFDTAVAGLALCTIPHPTTALAELRRVLRPGATLRILEHVRVPHRVWGGLQDWLTPVWRRIAGGCHLNRTTVQSVATSGCIVDHVTSHAGGLVVEILARSSSFSASPQDDVPTDARQSRTLPDTAQGNSRLSSMAAERYRSVVDRFRRATALLVILLLVQLTLVGSGFTCLPDAAAASGSEMASMPGMTGMGGPGAMSDMNGSRSNTADSEPATPSSDSCNFPWAPQGCSLMVPCAPHAMATARVASEAQGAPQHAELAWELDTPPSAILPPDPPPPRA